MYRDCVTQGLDLKPGYSEVIGSLLTLNEQALSASAMHGLGARGTAAIPEASEASSDASRGSPEGGMPTIHIFLGLLESLQT